jgi:hypothetical protein
MYNELECIKAEVALADLMKYHRSCLDSRINDDKLRIAGLQAEIWRRDLPIRWNRVSSLWKSEVSTTEDESWTELGIDVNFDVNDQFN